MRSFLMAAMGMLKLQQLRPSYRSGSKERGPLDRCECGRKLWSASEQRRGTCASCDHQASKPAA